MSFIPRLYLPGLSGATSETVLDPSAARYLTRVLRLGEGGRFIGFDDQGREYDLVLGGAEGEGVRAKVAGTRKPSGGTDPFRIALAQGLPKGPKMEIILRQGTEVGVNRFIPLITERSVSRPEPSQYAHKDDRWSKIIVEACRQCGRADLPSLDKLADWEQGLGTFREFDLILIPYEKEAPALGSVLESNPFPHKVLVLIGPEGGWSPREVAQAAEKGAHPVHLPTPILRTETAGVATVSMVRFFLSQPGGRQEQVP